MPVKNKIKQFIDNKGITPYKFQKDTGVASKTAYDLYNNPWQVPHATVLNKICDRYEIQPSEILEWIRPNSDLANEENK
ncbi:helix-turn-helix transcriptional regulator [Nostoc flagelliforme FACHB-838]|uniref:Helix-turn-helix transcriptional regulator n=1 Tax=Nostoc flagelliforme FACHB-838 TaxID=2692904 RepID=A0ABR8E376_9NOSO|nr:helix-turn-helix transcriptional regulator [Nostoc flagelliforme]MBD2535542.1 helix-turn-helix transcriptional regulator [Nostoc flagelliforme FACHB-838]